MVANGSKETKQIKVVKNVIHYLAVPIDRFRDIPMNRLADEFLVKTVPNPDLWLSSVDALMLDLVKDQEQSKNTISSLAHEAAAYHLQLGGHRIRARLALAACASLGVNETNAVALAAAVELLHNASLVHDDLQDEDLIRRGSKAVWAQFGSNVAICTGDLMLSAAYAAIAQTQCYALIPELLKQMHAKVSYAIKGQCSDLLLDSKTLNLKTYEDIAFSKSGALLSLPIELALIAGGKKEWVTQARQAADDFAVAYQIYDDIEDFEKDSSGDCIHHANILLVLQSDPSCINSYQAALDLGLLKLEQATNACNNLPMNSGHLLAELAQKLSNQLKATTPISSDIARQ